MENKTTVENMVAILADLWMSYRTDEEFADFFEYSDLGLPLAYLINFDVVEITPKAAGFITETFDLLLATLDIEDEGFETLDELLG